MQIIIDDDNNNNKVDSKNGFFSEAFLYQIRKPSKKQSKKSCDNFVAAFSPLCCLVFFLTIFN